MRGEGDVMIAGIIPLTSVFLSGCEHFRRRAISTGSRSLTLRVEQNRVVLDSESQATLAAAVPR